MGNNNDVSTVKYYIIGVEKNLFDDIFSQFKFTKLENGLGIKMKINNITISEKQKFQVKWEITFLNQLNDNNEDEILEFLKEELNFKIDEYDEKSNKIIDSKTTKSNQNFNVLIKFGDENLDLLMEILEYQTTSSLPQIGIVTPNEYAPNLFYNRFVTIIKGSIDDEIVMQQNFMSYMVERDCYYNQRWDQCIKLSPNYSLTSKDISNAKLNILLIGMSRCGKSTFINLIADKMVAYESPSFSSVTTKISEFPILLDSSNNKILEIRLFDTPGLMEKEIDVNGTKINTEKLVKDLIEEKFKKCEDSKDDIHLIYFFLGPQSNLEFLNSFFKFLIKINANRIKKKKFEIPIIFIMNENKNQDKLDELKNHILSEKNNIKNLYKEIEEIGKNNLYKKELSLKERMALSKTKNNSLKNNIIGVNLIKSKNINGNITEAFGFEQIMKATKYFLQKNNPFNEKDIIFLQKKVNSINHFIELLKSRELSKDENKEFLIHKNETKEIILKIGLENSLMNNCKDETEYLQFCRKESKLAIAGFCTIGFSAGLIPWPCADLAILFPLFFAMIKAITNCYNISMGEIPFTDMLKLVFGFAPNITSKAAGNISGLVTGAVAGENVFANLSEQILSKNVRLVHGTGNMNKVFQECAVKSKNILYEAFSKLYNCLPSFKFGAKKGMEKGAEAFANSYAQKLITNPKSVKAAANVAKDIGSKRASDLLSKSTIFFSKGLGSKLTHLIPIISCIFDCYNTYSVGDNTIKYCEEYIRKTCGGDLFLKRILDYQEFFNLIKLKSNRYDYASKYNILG